jgi:Protein of unknown function (DUF2953)
MEFVVGILAATAVAIFLALSMPVDLVVKVETSAANKVRVRLVWLCGLVNVNLSGRKPHGKRPARERKKFPGRALAFQRVRGALLTKGLPTAVARLLRRIVGAVKIRHFRLHCRFGFNDPADTGILLGVAAPVLCVLQTWGGPQFSAEADFDGEVLQADGNMDVRIYPIRIMGASAMFILSPAALRAAKAILSN